MAVMAYNEITLVDLIDPATYIYYADNAEGDNPSVSPDGKKYIGIYSGPSLEGGQPVNPPSGTVWSRYVGEDGKKGDAGADASKFRIDINQEEVLKFYRSKNQEGGSTSAKERERVFSPNELEISVFEQIASHNAGGENVTIGDTTGIPNITLSIFDHSSSWVTIFPISGLDSLPNKNEYFVYDTNNKKAIFKFDLFKQKMKNIQKQNDGETEADYKARLTPYLAWLSAAKTLIEEETILKIEYINSTSNEIYTANRFIKVRYGMNDDMAKFSLEAYGIYQSIQSTALEFTADGLTVRNGKLRVENNIGTPVIEATTNGNLKITGEIYATSGVFSGILEAASGNFSGEINANSGTIGGFQIAKGKLVSQDENSSIVLDGNEGKILANNIDLGIGAHIDDYIEIGQYVKLLNPEKNEGSFLNVKDDNGNKVLDFQQNGSLIIGQSNSNQIKIDGLNNEIKGWNPAQGSINWSITPKEAIFNNVIVRGSIKAATFEYGMVQAIGGQLLIRPSSRIKEVNGIQLTLETINAGFTVGDICLLDNGETKIYRTVASSSENKIQLNKEIDDSFIGSPIINLGTAGSVAIGINGSNTSNIMPAQAISVLEFNGSEQLNSKIILGKLPQDTLYGQASDTYGLYAENVVLNGALTTRNSLNNGSTNYSGIGTTLGTENAPVTTNMGDRFPKAKEENKLGQILIWAGATGTDKENIEGSKFFVDQYGNMYAGSGYFDGTIISNSIIQASEIRTATLTGIGNSPALVITDATNGISFKKGKDEIFSLTSEGLVAEGNIKFNTNFQVNENGELTLPKLTLKRGLELESNAITYNSSKIEILDEAVSLSPRGLQIFSVNTEGITSEKSLTVVGNVYYDKVCEYRKIKDSNGVVIGYDLYVK